MYSYFVLRINEMKVSILLIEMYSTNVCIECTKYGRFVISNNDA